MPLPPSVEARLKRQGLALPNVGDHVRVNVGKTHPSADAAGFCEDVVRDVFLQKVILEPYGRNYQIVAVVLTILSWVPLESCTVIKES